MDKPSNGFKKFYVKWFETSITIGLMGCLALGGWGLRTAVSNSKTLSGLESSRITPTERLQLWRAIESVKTEIADRAPSDWFKTGLESRLGRIESKLDKLQEEVAKLRATQELKGS